MPCVSVIIPAYNHEQYISQCIESVLTQTFTDFEIIVVDDGSQDGTASVLEQYRGRLSIIQQINRGTQAARNTAIRASSGQYIALLDSDDVWLPNKLERQVAAFVASPTAGLVYAPAHLIDAQGSRLGTTTIGNPIEYPEAAFEQILIENPVPALTALIRRECLQDIGMFDERLIGAADWDMWLRIAAQWRVVYIPEPLGLYRVHESNTTQLLRKTRSLFTEHMQVLERALADPSRPVSDQTRHRALARAHLIGADVAALAGDALSAGQEVSQAITLDPDFANDSEKLLKQLIYLANQYCGLRVSAKSYRRFFHEFSATLQPLPASWSRIRRIALAETAMTAVFSSHDKKQPIDIRSLILMAICARPSWLLNRGVRSIAADVFMGQKVTNILRQSLRRITSHKS